VAAVAAARLGTVTEASVSIDCTEPATTNGSAAFFQKCTTLPIHFVHHFFLWSQYKHLLSQSAVSTIAGSRGFSYAAPSIWKKTPSQNLEISNSLSFASFKKKNKTYYFSCTFS